MPAIKLVQPGWTNYTGTLHDIAFTAGVSGNVTQLQFDRIAANFAVEVSGTPGVQAGPSVAIKTTAPKTAEPNRQSGSQIVAPGSMILTGVGVPNSIVTAPVGTIYLRQDGGANTTLYVKESGTGNTGWVAK